MTTKPSTLQVAVDRLLGDTLDDFVRNRRDDGTSWRWISVDLYEATGIRVSHETLRSWYPSDVGRATVKDVA